MRRPSFPDSSYITRYKDTRNPATWSNKNDFYLVKGQSRGADEVRIGRRPQAGGAALLLLFFILDRQHEVFAAPSRATGCGNERYSRPRKPALLPLRGDRR